MNFNYLKANSIDTFMAKLGDKLAVASDLSVDELEQLSKKEFNDLISVIYEEVVITKDNIHLYYEFMSDEDLENWSKNLDIVFLERSRLLGVLKTTSDVLKDNSYILDKYEEVTTSKYDNRFIALSMFGVKDTLKPIDEYIAEIKESDAYKEYIAKTA